MFSSLQVFENVFYNTKYLNMVGELFYKNHKTMTPNQTVWPSSFILNEYQRRGHTNNTLDLLLCTSQMAVARFTRQGKEHVSSCEWWCFIIVWISGLVTWIFYLLLPWYVNRQYHQVPIPDSSVWMILREFRQCWSWPLIRTILVLADILVILISLIWFC